MAKSSISAICNSKEIFSVVDKLLTDQHALEKQIRKSQEIIKDFKTESSSEIASKVLLNHF